MQANKNITLKNANRLIDQATDVSNARPTPASVKRESTRLLRDVEFLENTPGQKIAPQKKIDILLRYVRLTKKAASVIALNAVSYYTQFYFGSIVSDIQGAIYKLFKRDVYGMPSKSQQFIHYLLLYYLTNRVYRHVSDSKANQWKTPRKNLRENTKTKHGKPPTLLNGLLIFKGASNC